jgi:hypothetical protein
MIIHKPIFPQSRGEENIERMMEESYRVISESLKR